MADGYSAAAWIAAHTALFNEMLDDTTSEPKIYLYDNSPIPVKLGVFVIDDTTSSVSGGDGDITINILTQEDAALASGVASYIDFVDGDDTIHYRMSCQQGTSPVAGKCVMNSLSIFVGAPITIISCVIPSGAIYS